jgi:Rrf2 family transcriptional regulator, nitric oxide-sensitive transcriptional repressor
MAILPDNNWMSISNYRPTPFFGMNAMFSQKVEYALRAAVYLASRSETPHTTDQIAETTKVPRAYLSKVLQAMVRAGVLRTQRGLGGGVCLAHKPEELTILQVVSAVDPIQRIRTCPLGLAAHGVHLCPLHARVDKALATVEEAFASTTLAEVLAEPTQSIPLCPFPAVKPKTRAS